MGQDPSPAEPLALIVPSLPPSTNHAYTNNPFGGRTLSEEGRSYKTVTLGYLVSKYPKVLALIRKNEPYLIVIRFQFPDIENRGWPKKTSTRYKKFDADNRLKLFLDVLKDAGGIDDSQFTHILVLKEEGNPWTEAYLWNLAKEVRSIGELIQSLGL